MLGAARSVAHQPAGHDRFAIEKYCGQRVARCKSEDLRSTGVEQQGRADDDCLDLFLHKDSKRRVNFAYVVSPDHLRLAPDGCAVHPQAGPQRFGRRADRIDE